LEDLKCKNCRWKYTNSNEIDNCTNPSVEISEISADDGRTIEIVDGCHHFYSVIDEENFLVDDYDKNQYEMVWK